MIGYILQNEDGGWGLHIEGHSTMFSTALSYICMRILGEGPDDNGGQDNACLRAREWILDHGGVTHMPSWGKTWLSVRTNSTITTIYIQQKIYVDQYFFLDK